MSVLPATPAAHVVDLISWQDVSRPVDHGSSCCASARGWLGAIHAAGGPTAALSGLGWISEMYPWGPTQWPMSWCELVEQQKLDCGAHASVAREVARQGGVQLLGVQLLLWAGARDIAHWGSAWREGGVTPTWLFEGLYYHEAVGAAADGLVVLDTTRNARVLPDGGSTNGSVAAIRVSGADAEVVRWGPHDLTTDKWMVLAGVAP